MRSPGCQSRPMATVAMPSEVFFTSAISAGSAWIRRAAARAQAFVGLEPLVVVEAAEFEAVVGQMLHGVGAGRHSGATAAWFR